MDGADTLVPCPYFPEHKVRYGRMPYHMIKCREKYTGPPLDACPYNATHLVPKGALLDHYRVCQAYYYATRARMETKTASFGPTI